MERDIRELAREFLTFVYDATEQPGIVCDEDGTIVEAVDRSRIGSSHAAARRVISGECDEAFVTPAEAARDPRMRSGISVPIVVDGKRTGSFGLTGPLEMSQPVIRLAAAVLASWMKERRGHAERFALAGQMAAAVAHGINNPLAFVTANVRFLEETAGEPAASREEVDAAFRETRSGLERIKHMVDSLRAFAGDGDGDGGRCLVKEVIDDALRLAEPRLTAGVRLEVSVASDLPEPAIGRWRIASALLSLLLNAADSVAEIAPRDAPAIRISSAAREGGIEIAVEDNGRGLSLKAQAHLFEPFFTTKGPSYRIGFGLAAAREHVERHGGRVEGHNLPTGGARFTIWLPARAQDCV